MRTSVCIFLNENDAKEAVNHLREKQLGVTLVNQTLSLKTGEEFQIRVLAAERPEHPLILNRVAEMDSLHRSLARCHNCQSARLSIGLTPSLSPARRLARSLFERLSRSPHPTEETIICRDCSGTVDFTMPGSSQNFNEQPIPDAIAA